MSHTPFTLNLDSYYSPLRPHISNSMIQTYIKSPELYRMRYIDKTLHFKTTGPMKRGLVVDHILTQPGDMPYVPDVKKKDDAEMFERLKQLKKQGLDKYIVPRAIWQEAIQVANDIKAEPFWQEGLARAQFQQVLEGSISDLLVCGLPDRVDRTGPDTWRISDVKVVSPVKISSPKKWLVNAHDMGYIRQGAIYRKLWADLQGVPVSNVTFTHIVAAYEEEGFTNIKLYEFPPDMLDHAYRHVQEVCATIKEGHFEKHDIVWGDMINLGELHHK